MNVDKNNTKYRSTALDRELQHFNVHGYAKVKILGGASYVPLEDLPEETPIIAVRKYEVSAAIMHLAYYYRYGSHRCNLANDGELGEAVYCYADIDTLLKKLTYSDLGDRRTVIGVVSGYLHKCSNSKGRINLIHVHANCWHFRTI